MRRERKKKRKTGYREKKKKVSGKRKSKRTPKQRRTLFELDSAAGAIMTLFFFFPLESWRILREFVLQSRNELNGYLSVLRHRADQKKKKHVVVWREGGDGRRRRKRKKSQRYKRGSSKMRAEF